MFTTEEASRFSIPCLGRCDLNLPFPAAGATHVSLHACPWLGQP
jgi:hypothetical protein